MFARKSQILYLIESLIHIDLNFPFSIENLDSKLGEAFHICEWYFKYLATLGKTLKLTLELD